MVIDNEGNVVGAVGVAIDIDERRRLDAERVGLYTLERQARESAERSMEALTRLQDMTFSLSGASSVDEVARVIVDRCMAALGASSAYFGDARPRETDAHAPRVAAGLDARLVERYRFVDAAADLPAAVALRSGAARCSSNRRAGRNPDYPTLPRDDVHGAYAVSPLLVSAVPIAALALGFDQPREFNEEDRAFVVGCRRGVRASARTCVAVRSRNATAAIACAPCSTLRNDWLRSTTPMRNSLWPRAVASTIGRWGTVMLVEPDGRVRRAVSVHADPERQQLLDHTSELDLAHDVCQRVADTRQAALLPERFGDVDDQLQRFGASLEDIEAVYELGCRSAVIVPMIVGNRLRRGARRRRRSAPPAWYAEMELALDLGRRTASAYERARLLRLEQDAVRTRAARKRSAARSRAPRRVGVTTQHPARPAPELRTASSWPPRTSRATAASRSAATGTTRSPCRAASSCS